MKKERPHAYTIGQVLLAILAHTSLLGSLAQLQLAFALIPRDLEEHPSGRRLLGAILPFLACSFLACSFRRRQCDSNGSHSNNSRCKRASEASEETSDRRTQRFYLDHLLHKKLSIFRVNSHMKNPSRGPAVLSKSHEVLHSLAKFCSV